MRLRHIEVFHAVFSCGSVTRAAEILSVSQPSVSKVLAHAEQQLGYPLFERVRGKLVPTQEANQLFVIVSQITDGVDRLRQLAANLRSVEKGAIRIAATPAFGMDFLPGAVASYRQAHGDIMFSIETLRHEEIAPALLESRIDIGLAFDTRDMAGIKGERLGYGRFVVLTPPDMVLGDGNEVQFSDLAGLPFIRLDNQGPLDRFLTAQLESSAIELESVAIAGSYQLAKALVAHGVGVCIADEMTARSAGHDDVAIRRLSPELQFRISALHIEQEPTSLVCSEFLDHLKTSLQTFLDRPAQAG